MSDPIIVLGSGPAGLATAYKILKESQKKVMIVDKARTVGGFGASFKWKRHILDYGPHAFHARGDAPEYLIRSLFSAEPDSLIEGKKNVCVYLRGKKFNYPLQAGEVLLKISPLLSIRIIIEFLLTSMFHAMVSIPIENFESWGRKRFGTTLYKMSFGNYTEKVWKAKADKISEKFAAEKIQGFNFIDLIKRLLRVGGQVSNEPYFQNWIYHKHGSGALYQMLANEIMKLGGQIVLDTTLESIHLQGSTVKSVTLLGKDGTPWNLPCGYLVSTIPLPTLISLFGNHVPFVVRHAASKLSYISLVLVYLELEMERLNDCHWFYLLDGGFTFNRVTEQKNLSPATIEDGKTVISFELTCKEGDDIWRLPNEKLCQLAMKDAENIRFLRLKNISDFLVVRVPNAYEIYYKNFDQHAELLLSYLTELKNIASIGRRGLFLQGDMHQSIQMGLDIGDILVQGKPDRHQVEAFCRKYITYV